MVRDVSDDKTDYTLVLDGPMFDRWAEHLTKGAKKYDARNWMKAEGIAEYERFMSSALRHFLQWFRGEEDEDHAAAVFFNINGAEYVNAKMGAPVLDLWDNVICGDSNCADCAEPDMPSTPWKNVAATAKVGDVDANDILDAISQPGGAGDLADDYNYLRNRVQELSSRFDREYPSANDPRISDPDEFNTRDDGGW